MKRILRTAGVLIGTLLASKAVALEVGDRAPGFTAPSTGGEIVLHQVLERGPVVLALYFADFTPGWTSEMRAFQSDIERFEELNAQVLGVSADSLQTHRQFAAELGLDFPLISDPGTIRELYGSGRITYLIDRSGTIRYIHKGMPENEVLIREIRKLERE